MKDLVEQLVKGDRLNRPNHNPLESLNYTRPSLIVLINIDSIWVEFILGKLPISFALIMMLLLVLLDYQRYTMYIITCHYVYEALEYI